MAEKLRIFPILSTQLQFSVSPPIFEPLATQVLGNAASDGDGFNADLLAVAQQLDSDTALVSAGDQDLADAGFTPGEFAAANIDPLVDQTGVFNSSGDGLLKELGDDAQVPTDSPPPVKACEPIRGNYNVPACDFGDTVLDGKFEPGIFQFGNCQLTLDTLIHDKAGNELVPLGAAFVTRDAPFLSVKAIPGASGPNNVLRVIQLAVNATKQGHFQAVVHVPIQTPRSEYYLGVCVDIVDSATLTSNVQISALPLRG